MAAAAMPEPVAEHRASGGRCWRCGHALYWEVAPGGRLLEHCAICDAEWNALRAYIANLRDRLGRGAPPVPPALWPRPLRPELPRLVPFEEPPRRRQCQCGRLMRRRRDGQRADACYYCEHRKQRDKGQARLFGRRRTPGHDRD